ncbi:MAG TPA: NmrA/HSCARG family protein [Lysobacter sp.]|nr:NmrA/HSCARG family protein [Lysobacter sp.]
MPPVLAIIGATGAQGGGLARAALSDPERAFVVRALTRRPMGERAVELAGLGAEVMFADLDDEASLDAAFRGVHGVFAVTNFWEHHSPDAERRQAGNVARAALRAGVRHVVWSTLEDSRTLSPLGDERIPTLLGRFKVPHMDAKAEANAVFDELRVPTTFLYTSFYWDNFIHFGMGPKRGADGALALALPMGDAPLPGIAAEDIGRCALALFKRGEHALGQHVGIAGEHLTVGAMAQAMARALGEPVHYHALAPAEYAAFGFPGAVELANMFQYKHDFSAAYCASRPVAPTRALHPGLMTFEHWLQRHGERLRA